MTKTLGGGKIVEVGQDPKEREIQWDTWQGYVPGPWPVTPSTDNCKQQHIMNKHNFVSSFPGLAMTSLLGKEVMTYWTSERPIDDLLNKGEQVSVRDNQVG